MRFTHRAAVLLRATRFIFRTNARISASLLNSAAWQAFGSRLMTLTGCTSIRTKAFAAFESLQVKFAVMLDVAILYLAFRFRA